MLTSTLLFVFGDSLIYFILGSAFIATGFSFTSGTSSAFLHNTLIGLKREKEFSELDGKINANASLASAIMIFALPFLTEISLVTSIALYIIFDFLGLLVSFSLYSPKIRYSAKDLVGESIFSQIRKFKGTGFFLFSLFLGLITGILLGLSPFKEPFLESLGLPIVLMGVAMAFSRVVWYVVGNNLKILKVLSLKKILFLEIILFSIFLIVVSQLKNPYIILGLLGLIKGYHLAREPLFNEYFLNKFYYNKRFKATMLSIKRMIGSLFMAIFTFAIGFVMEVSYSLGFLISGMAMVLILLPIYPLLHKTLTRIES
ncbi:MAG: hypothetical protein ACMXX6_00785 [Candidatus Woesearchaeota archaeon]